MPEHFFYQTNIFLMKRLLIWRKKRVKDVTLKPFHSRSQFFAAQRSIELETVRLNKNLSDLTETIIVITNRTTYYENIYIFSIHDYTVSLFTSLRALYIYKLLNLNQTTLITIYLIIQT